jgi:hypothetical protein
MYAAPDGTSGFRRSVTGYAAGIVRSAFPNRDHVARHLAAQAIAAAEQGC